MFPHKMCETIFFFGLPEKTMAVEASSFTSLFYFSKRNRIMPETNIALLIS